METVEERLKRFLLNSPNEIFFTILNSISNFTVPEIRSASSRDLHNLAVLGVHGVAQTISEQIYGHTGLSATRFYLENFVDRPTDAVKFSDIAAELHSFRNIHAHRWSSRLSHHVGFNTTVAEGWKRDGDDIHFNPIVFITRFDAGFSAGSPMWEMPRRLEPLARLRQKYRFLRQWLELSSDDPVDVQLRSLGEAADLTTAERDEDVVRRALCARFGITV